LDRALSFCFASRQRTEAFGGARKETLDIAQSSDRQDRHVLAPQGGYRERLPQMVARSATWSIESEIF
jgi:hypothetical protein